MTRPHRANSSAPRQLRLFDTGGDAEPPADPADETAPAVRLSRRARRMALHVGHDGNAELVVPHGTPPDEVRRFLESQRAWLSRVQAAQRRRYGDIDRSRPDALRLEAVGERWRIERRVRPGQRLRCHLRPGATPSEFSLRLDGDAGIDDAAERGAVQRRLRRRALDYFEATLAPLAAEMGCGYKRVQVRAQRSCWGSYSASGTISMNYAALFLPPDLARYLCVHELAHARHMDHSKSFWNLVERHAPDARALDRRLASRHDVLPAWFW